MAAITDRDLQIAIGTAKREAKPQWIIDTDKARGVGRLVFWIGLKPKPCRVCVAVASSPVSLYPAHVVHPKHGDPRERGLERRRDPFVNLPQ